MRRHSPGVANVDKLDWHFFVVGIAMCLDYCILGYYDVFI